MYLTTTLKLFRVFLTFSLVFIPYVVMGQKQPTYQLIVRVVRPEWVHKPVIGKQAPASKMGFSAHFPLKDAKSDKEFLKSLQSVNKNFRIESLKNRIAIPLKVGETWKAPTQFCDVPLELTIETSSTSQKDGKSPVRLLYNGRVIQDDIDKYLNTLIPISFFVSYNHEIIRNHKNPSKRVFRTKHLPRDTTFVCVVRQ